MHHQTWNQFLEELPLILAGPILQRTEPDEVTVWLALKQACHVKLKVYETTDGGENLAACQFVGDRSTVALGKALHVVAVTARSITGQYLVSDRIYAYDLDFTPLDLQPFSAESTPSDSLSPLNSPLVEDVDSDSPQGWGAMGAKSTVTSTPQTLRQALCSGRFPQVDISYFPHQKPTFVLPPQQIQDLRMVQGSCRKPHGEGFDALAILDCLIAETAAYPRQRPQQLFLTGDQIYGDDVADPLLWVASWLGDALLGWEEALPVGKKEPTEITYHTPKELPAGQRAEVVTKQAGFTAGLQNKRDRVTSHLLSFGEYCAAYLLVWSPVCWPATLPLGREMTRDRQAQKRWDHDAQELRQCIHTLWKVRRALANIPVYSIFDDHDVSDDWNLNQAWCLRVLGRPLGRRAVQNALLAYAVFQAWGNTPEQFVAGQSGGKLLEAARTWSGSQGRDADACEAIAQYIGLPRCHPQTGLPVFVPDGSVLILERHPEALTWHYTVRSGCHEVIVLDTRTWRGYPDEKAIAPPMLLCPTAFERQLVRPLQATEASDLTTFVVAPTNVFGLQVIDWIHHLQLRRKKVFSTDVGDAWNINMPALAKLLTTLFDQRQQVIVLSGDIHYSSVVRLSHQGLASTPDSASVLVQLTSSALKNKETLTQILHTRLKDWLLPEKLRRWVGWSSPYDMVELSRRQAQQLHQKGKIRSAQRSPMDKKDRSPATPQSELPEWACVLEWVPRQKAQFAAFGIEVPWLLTPSQRTLDSRYPWLRFLMFWRQRWFQEGREVVGLNNIALVQVLPPDAQSPAIVVQELFWFSPWSPTQIVSSLYATPLTPNEKQLANLQPPVPLPSSKKGRHY